MCAPSESPTKNIRTILALLPAALLLLAGCATPLPREDATEAWRVGPLLEGARTASGASLLAVRPFYSREAAPTNAPDLRVENNILWPLAVTSRRDDRHYWRALLFYGTGSDAAADNDAYRFRLFPIYFQGRTKEGRDYLAVFPLGGTICDFLFFSEASFFLFPLYGTSETAGVKTRTVLWPFYLTRHGDRVDQLRVFPFYGRREQRTLYQTNETHFVAWPFWTDHSTSGASVNGGGFVFFPFYGHTRYERRRRGAEESWLLLPPLFAYGKGDDGFHKLNAPWPFIRQLDHDDLHERHVWPLCGVTTNNVSRRSYVLWPFFSKTESGSDPASRRTAVHCPLPFYFHAERPARRPANGPGGKPPAPPSGDGDEETEAPGPSRATYTRVWPLFSHRNTESGTFTRFPEFSLWSQSQQVERNWAPLWSLYTHQHRPDGAHCNDILWGLLSWGSDAEDRGFVQLLWFLRFGRGSRRAAKAPGPDPAPTRKDGATP